MFLRLNHKQLEVYKSSKKLLIVCYKIALQLPADEKFNMVPQIRRAALSIVLNISEGASRKSAAERKRFYEISRGSLIEIDAAFDVANELEYLQHIDTTETAELMNKVLALLNGIIKNC
jgi:four helix bundle protein